MVKSPSSVANAPVTGAAEEGAPRKSYNQPCLIAQTLGVLGDRWTLLILRDLMAGLHRYSDILENCAGMSPNVLADRLKRLEADGLVDRQYFRELPPRVEYTLTDKGWSVRPILLSMIEWGRQNLGPLDIESVGRDISTDFAVRVVPTFSFHPERAGALAATMIIEISDCSDCNTWTFEISEGRIHPRRQAVGTADVRLSTTTQGFFSFLRGEAPAETCGTLDGAPETAAAIQMCFLSS
jgi:DNA-binding HxlR family transcriptional regulator